MQAPSISCCFAEAFSGVVSAEEFSGFGIDGDEFAVAPDAWVLFVRDRETVDGVAHGCEFFGGWGWELLLHVDAVGKVLMVEAWGVGGLLDVESVVDGADDVVGYGGDDGGTAGSSHDEG